VSAWIWPEQQRVSTSSSDARGRFRVPTVGNRVVISYPSDSSDQEAEATASRVLSGSNPLAGKASRATAPGLGSAPALAVPAARMGKFSPSAHQAIDI
jgi:hypothetical protein